MVLLHLLALRTSHVSLLRTSSWADVECLYNSELRQDGSREHYTKRADNSFGYVHLYSPNSDRLATTNVTEETHIGPLYLQHCTSVSALDKLKYRFTLIYL